MQREIIHCHGSGNDFLLIDELEHLATWTDEERQQLAQTLCDRQNGIGADGILFVQPSHTGLAKMRIFNADGSEASMCGNGLRCVARYVAEKFGEDEFVVETMKADLRVKKAEPIFGQLPTYQVEISPILFDVSQLPMNFDKPTCRNERIPELSERLTFTAVAVPNPHLISIVDSEIIQSNVQKELAKYVNGPNDWFPDGVNVSFVKPLGVQQIYVRTFERGVGFTNACGTAMSASSLVTCLEGINNWDQPIDVYNNGGKVRCVVHRDQRAIDLIGNATYIKRLVIDLNQVNSFQVVKREQLNEEQEYDQLQAHCQKVVEEMVFQK
jgi:diaminopimelate epimerase